MTFESDLTLEQIKAFLDTHSQPFSFVNMFREDLLLSSVKNNRLILMKTAPATQVSRYKTFPFIGKIVENEQGTTIKGRFSASRIMWLLWFVIVGCFWTFAFIYMNADLTALAVLGVWTALFLFLLAVAPAHLYPKHRKAVIEFIEEHLEKQPQNKDKAI